MRILRSHSSGATGYLGKAEVMLAEDPGTFTRRNRHPRDRIPLRTYKNPKE
jgi:hypothetical protein